MGWLAPVHAGRGVLQEKSEGSFGGVFPGGQKRQNPHKAGFGSASYLVGRGNLNLAFIILIFIINIRFDFELEYQLAYLAELHSTSPPICI
ncbi:hypothetical protein HX836_04165 [Pseudomonas yamanorum]|uniref:hypothetical protein n=1 Tax=Pseudomonas yamanorum TaxID=515393 RepID=UPI0015A0A9DE|nr:hypothetical protein [Pseudomonas yamanorum]NVZ80987.1 hypothetical protein [Pseudomonas yamanorum]